MKASLIGKLKTRARELNREVFTLYFAVRDPRTPWLPKAIAALVVAYALSPIDLIPDFIPILGYIDDLILLPLGIVLVVKMIPEDIIADCRKRAAQRKLSLPRNWRAAAVIVMLWLLAAFLVGGLLLRSYVAGEYWDARFGY